MMHQVMLAPTARGTVTYTAPPGNYSISVSRRFSALCTASCCVECLFWPIFVGLTGLSAVSQLFRVDGVSYKLMYVCVTV